MAFQPTHLFKAGGLFSLRCTDTGSVVGGEKVTSWRVPDSNRRLESGVVSGPDDVGFCDWFSCSEGHSLMPEQYSPDEKGKHLLFIAHSLHYLLFLWTIR